MKNFFTVGQNKIGYISQKFKDNFSGMEVKMPKKLKLEHKVLEKPMIDKDILREWKPKEATLGELAWAMKNPEKAEMLMSGYANIFYIRDKINTLWAVRAYWGGDGWVVSVYSVADRGAWPAGSQVLSQVFGFGTLGDSELGLLERVKELENFRKSVEKVLNLN